MNELDSVHPGKADMPRRVYPAGSPDEPIVSLIGAPFEVQYAGWILLPNQRVSFPNVRNDLPGDLARLLPEEVEAKARDLAREAGHPYFALTARFGGDNPGIAGISLQDYVIEAFLRQTAKKSSDKPHFNEGLSPFSRTHPLTPNEGWPKIDRRDKIKSFGGRDEDYVKNNFYLEERASDKPYNPRSLQLPDSPIHEVNLTATHPAFSESRKPLPNPRAGVVLLPTAHFYRLLRR